MREVGNMNEEHGRGKALVETLKQHLGAFVKGLTDLRWQDIPAGAKEYIQEHPGLTAVQVLAVSPVVSPWLVASPLLAALGFGNLGPIASTLLYYA